MAAHTIWMSFLRQLPLSGRMSCPQCRRDQSLGSELLHGPPNRLAISSACVFNVVFIPSAGCEGRCALTRRKWHRHLLTSLGYEVDLCHIGMRPFKDWETLPTTRDYSVLLKRLNMTRCM